MRTIQIENLRKIKKAIPKVERKIKVNVQIGKTSIEIKGSEVNEFLAEKIFKAVDFGFDVEDALLIENQNFGLEFIKIKEHTYRKSLKDIRARLIGRSGKAKKTIEKLTGAVIVIKDNNVGVIADSERMEQVVQSIESIIRGAKHGNVFSYLEKQNASINRYDEEDLGLKG